MNLHEYQGKQLFAEYGLPVSKGFAAETPRQAVEAAEQIGGNMWVVKARYTPVGAARRAASSW
jgi:succinyl-CoA synthetase beta subunit